MRGHFQTGAEPARPGAERGGLYPLRRDGRAFCAQFRAEPGHAEGYPQYQYIANQRALHGRGAGGLLRGIRAGGSQLDLLPPGGGHSHPAGGDADQGAGAAGGGGDQPGHAGGCAGVPTG